MKRGLILMVAIVFAGCRATVKIDDRPPFTVDPTQPFSLVFGRGSGWKGLDTIRVDQSGSVIVHRKKYELKDGRHSLSWEVATVQLSAESLAEVLKAVESNRLMQLHREYSPPPYVEIHDGSQWALWIKQGEQEKSVYFNNNFPRQIMSFAEQLDGILARAGLDNAQWQPTPDQDFRAHEQDLWNSIRR